MRESLPVPEFRVVDDLDVLDAAQISAVQHDNLLATVAAISRQPKARARWAGIDEVREVADLTKRIGLMSPEAFEELSPPRVDDLVLDSLESGLVLRSSGTSGRRKVLFHSWGFNDRVAALGARGVRAAVTEAPKRVANCLYPAELNGAFSFAQDVTRALGAQSYPIGASMKFAELLEVIDEHRVDTLVGSPAMGADFMSGEGNARFLGSLRTFLYIGENLGAGRAEVIAAACPQVEVRSLSYSTSETGPIGYQCRFQTGGTHHIHEDVMVVEVIDPDTGAAVAEGQEGEVIVSTLSDTGMPLLRYRVGDRGVLRRGRCECGSHALRLKLTGRVPRSFNVDGATISQELVMAQLGEFGVADPADCQFQIVRGADRRFTVVLLLSERVPARPTTEQVLARLRDGYHLGRVFAMPGCKGLEFRVVPAGEFARNSRGKSPFFIEI